MVRNLFLIRHADALPQSNDQRDFQRVLSGHGTKQAIILGQYLKGLDTRIEVFFSSPSHRTLSTIEKIKEMLSYDFRVVEVEEFYEATVNTMVASINRLEDKYTNVAIVGHNPSISQLSDYLVQGEYIGFSTATCVHLELELDSWSLTTRDCAVLKDHYYPGKLKTH